MQNRVRASDSSVGDNIRLAVAAILGSNLAFSLSDAAIKLISANFVLWQIFVIRSIIAIPLLIAVILLWFPLDVFSAAPVWLGGTAQPDAYAHVDRVSLIPAASPARRSGGDILHTADLHHALRGAFHWRQNWTDGLGLGSSGVRGCCADPQAHARRLQRIRTLAARLGGPVRLVDDSDQNEVSRRTSPSSVARCQFLVSSLLGFWQRS